MFYTLTLSNSIANVIKQAGCPVPDYMTGFKKIHRYRSCWMLKKLHISPSDYMRFFRNMVLKVDLKSKQNLVLFDV